MPNLMLSCFLKLTVRSYTHHSTRVFVSATTESLSTLLTITATFTGIRWIMDNIFEGGTADGGERVCRVGGGGRRRKGSNEELRSRVNLPHPHAQVYSRSVSKIRVF